MEKKAVSGIMLTLLLMSMLTLAFKIQPVKASGTIYIRADGSIDPPSANITSVDNVTYTFTGDNYDSIVIERDNIVVNGAGYTVQGTGSGTGINVNGVSNVTIKNTVVKGFTDGILISASNITVKDVNAYSNENGMRISGQFNNITDSTFNSNKGHGIYVDYGSNNIFKNIDANLNDADHDYFRAAGIYVNHGSNNIFVNISASYNGVSQTWYFGGIYLYYSTYNNFTNAAASDNYYHGIYLESSSNNVFRRSTASRNKFYNHGIYLIYSNNNTLADSSVSDNSGNGIAVYHSYNNILTNNTASTNSVNIEFSYAGNNAITDGAVLNARNIGIVFGYSSNNQVYHNNFIGNNRHASGGWDPRVNVLDLGPEIGGNYWSGHVCTGNPSDGSEPYIIDAYNIDHYPFQDPNGWLKPEAYFTYSPDYPAPNQTITFNASLSTPDGGTITSYEWNFGDGNTTTVAAPIITHVYNLSATYNVTLTITDSEGLNDITWKNVPVYIHDIAIINLIPSKNVVGEGYTISINVTITNQGELTETFNVTASANTTAIQTITNVVLTSRGSTILTFTWNTTGWAKGNYTLSAYAWPVPGETDTADNTLVGGWVIVAMVGDIRVDGIVDIYDLIMVATHFGEDIPFPIVWPLPPQDVNGDGVIDIYDIIILATRFGQTDP